MASKLADLLTDLKVKIQKSQDAIDAARLGQHTEQDKLDAATLEHDELEAQLATLQRASNGADLSDPLDEKERTAAAKVSKDASAFLQGAGLRKLIDAIPEATQVKINAVVKSTDDAINTLTQDVIRLRGELLKGEADAARLQETSVHSQAAFVDASARLRSLPGVIASAKNSVAQLVLTTGAAADAAAKAAKDDVKRKREAFVLSSDLKKALDVLDEIIQLDDAHKLIVETKLATELATAWGTAKTDRDSYLGKKHEMEKKRLEITAKEAELQSAVQNRLVLILKEVEKIKDPIPTPPIN